MCSCGQVVTNASHHDASIGESSTADSLFHVATDTYMDLEDNCVVNTKHILLNWSISWQKYQIVALFF